MSADDVTSEIITPMRALFTTPRPLEPDEERVALRQYVEALERFERETLRRAWFLVRNKHIGRAWPAVGTLIKACVDHARTQEPEHKPDYLKCCWEGGPKCERCQRKARTEGFYTAPAADYERDAAIRAELSSWMRGLVDAKRSNPPSREGD